MFPTYSLPQKHKTQSQMRLSLNNESAALEFASEAQVKGVPVETRVEITSDASIWRIQVPGFETREEASEYSKQIVEVLGLGKVWIFQEDRQP